MGRLLLLFVLVPAIELWLLIEIGARIGATATLLLIVSTGALGAYLARRQGLGVLRAIQAETGRGRIPASPLADGLFILVAAAFLLTPGILTDACGFLLLVPQIRDWIKKLIWRRLETAGGEGRFFFSFRSGERQWPRSEPINVTPRETERESVQRPRLPAPDDGSDH